MEEEIKREDVLEAARKGTDEYYEMIDDKELILEAMQINPRAVLYATNELIACDKQLALEALEYDIYCYAMLNGNLQQDEDIIETMFWCATKEIDDILGKEGKDREEAEDVFCNKMYDIVSKFNNAVEYKSDYVLPLDNKEQAIMLMKAGGDLYPCLSEEFINDEEIFWTAYESCNCDDWDLFESAGTGLTNNKQFILKLIETTGNPFWITDIEELTSDTDAVYKALEVSDADAMWDWIEEIDDKFKYDRKFVIRAVAKDKEALEWACEEFQKDDTILTEAMLYAAKEKERLEEKEKKARELYFSYEEQVEKNGQTQSDDE